MLYVDGMNGVISHIGTIQWLYSLCAAKVGITRGYISSSFAFITTRLVKTLPVQSLLGRVALGAQRPVVVKLSRKRSVGPSVCPVHCGKPADRIRMPFGKCTVGRTGPGMRQVVGFGDRYTRKGTFGANFGRAIVTNGDFVAYLSDSAATRPSSRITLDRLVGTVLVQVI